MKKIIALSLLTASLAATTAFGQGYLSFQEVNSSVYDGFTTPGASAVHSTVDVALFWAAANTANPMPLSSTPTSGNSTTAESYTDAQAWTDILNSSFTLAQNASTGDSSVIQLSSSKGGINYLAGSTFGLNNSTASGSIALVELSWSSAYASPTAAQTAGSAIGWNYVPTFTLGASATDPGAVSPPITAFGTFVPSASATPEPATMALAGLGGLALLGLRRKK